MNATRHRRWLINIGSGNGSVPSGNDPLPESMLKSFMTTYDVTRSQLVKRRVISFIWGFLIIFAKIWIQRLNIFFYKNLWKCHKNLKEIKCESFVFWIKKNKSSLMWQTRGVVTKPISSFRFSLNFHHCSPIEYDVHIWQVSPQLSCGDTN